MSEDRRTKEHPAPGQDPREVDGERRTDAALDELGAQVKTVHNQPARGTQGTTADAPGRDLDELADAPEATDLR